MLDLQLLVGRRSTRCCRVDPTLTADGITVEVMEGNTQLARNGVGGAQPYSLLYNDSYVLSCLALERERDTSTLSFYTTLT